VKAKRAPEISVVVPVFNTAELVRASVSSVLDHTRAEIEIICVDDGSTDGSAEILELLAANDDRVCVVRLGTNHGASTARNAGIESAKGDHIFFLDSDDTVPPGALDLLLSAARQTGSTLTIGKLLWFKSVAESTSPPEQIPGNQIVIADIRESAYLQSVPGCHCCNLYARTLLEQHRIRYDTDLTYGEDQLFQATAMVCAGKVTIIDEFVYVYHHYRGQSLTRKPPGLTSSTSGAWQGFF
jgi:glycosyltransferase involved in cell wall biosynthesis